MNTPQKSITLVFLVFFWLSALWCPWELSDGLSHMDTTKYSPIFKAPTGGTWQKRRPSANIAYTWGFLLVNYGIFMLLVADPKKSQSV